MTFSEEISYYYGANKAIKGLIGVLILFASVGWLGAHILGGGMYLAWIVEMDLAYAKLIVALGFGIYVIIGGYVAVVWTDTIQAVVLFVGFMLMAWLALDKIGGWEGLQAAVNYQPFAFLQGSQALPSISLVVAICISVIVTPSYRQRIYSADSADSVRKSFYITGVLYLFFAIIPGIIGIAAFALNPELDNANFAFPYMATDVLPMAMGLIVLIAGLSATMSSASSDAIAGVSIMLRDIYQLFAGHPPQKHQTLPYSRWGLIVITGLAVLFTLYSTDIIDYIKYMVAIIMSGMFVCTMMGKYWRRATWQGGIAALAGGAISSVLIISIDSWNAFWGNPVIPAILFAALAGGIVSLITPPNIVLPEEALRILTEERESMEMREEKQV